MKIIIKDFLASIILTVSLVEITAATTIDLTSGTTGTTLFNQSFNETRAADVTVLTPDLLVTSMTLSEFNISTTSGTIGARIYNSDGSLHVAADLSVSSGFDQSVTIPISTILEQGFTYRMGFFISAGLNGGSGDIFNPDPSGLAITPYSDSTGSLQISGAFSFPDDTFPTNINGSLPLMTIEAHLVPEPASLGLLTSGFVLIVALRKRFKG